MFKLDIIMRNIKRFKPIRIFSTCGGFGYWWGRSDSFGTDRFFRQLFLEYGSADAV